MEIEEATGERREMIDKLLAKAGELLGDGRCGFRSCYGQGEQGVSLQIEGSLGEATAEFVVCEDHMFMVELVDHHAPNHEALAGFFVKHLDERLGFQDAKERITVDPGLN